MTKMEEICAVSFVGHKAASELLREFTGKEGGLATVDWYMLRNKISDVISMTRIDEREKCRQLLSEAEKREVEARVGWAFAEGDLVRKKSGSWWEGRVVGTYSTKQTPRGYAVQLDKPFGPVQIYPETALESALQSEER